MQNTNIDVNDTLKVEFEESDLTKRLVECKVKDIEYDRLTLDYSRVSPYYYQFLPQYFYTLLDFHLVSKETKLLPNNSVDYPANQATV